MTHKNTLTGLFRLVFFFIPLFWASAAIAHTPLLIIADNGDGTILIQGDFSTGQGAEGIDLFIKNKQEGKILLHKKFPDSSEFEIQIPKEPYYVVMDAGPGHKIVKQGIAPPGGFTVNVDAASKEIENEDLSGLPLPIPAIVAIVLIAGLLIFFLPKYLSKKESTV